MGHSKFLTNLCVLIVDESEVVVSNFRVFIGEHGGSCSMCNDYSSALLLVETCQFDVIVCDVELSNGVTYVDFIDSVRLLDREVTVMLTTVGDVDGEWMGEMIKRGVYSVMKKPFDGLGLGLILLQASKSTRSARKNEYIARNLRNKIRVAQRERDRIFLNTLTALISALEQKDEYTKDHSEGVSKISEMICMEYSDNIEFLEDVVISARLHDIGKIGIRDEILFKKSELDASEYELVKRHPELSYKIVKPIDPSGKICEYVLHHHERWDGSGYPHGLSEKMIPAGARILAVSDVFNALVTDRPYRVAMGYDDALDVMMSGRGIKYDVEIVDILYKLVKTKKV